MLFYLLYNSDGELLTDQARTIKRLTTSALQGPEVVSNGTDYFVVWQSKEAGAEVIGGNIIRSDATIQGPFIVQQSPSGRNTPAYRIDAEQWNPNAFCCHLAGSKRRSRIARTAFATLRLQWNADRWTADRGQPNRQRV